MKRFWREVTVDAERVVRLDERPVRTPGRVPLALPTGALADAIAAEWRAVGETVNPRAMPLTGLANAAIDRVAPDRATFAAGLARYGETDLLHYRADGPDELVEQQRAAWDPLLDWARRRYDVHFVLQAGVMPRAQPAATVARLADAVAAQDAWTLAGLSPVVTIGGSLIAALALLEGAADAETVWTATQLDELWQAELWGEDPLATQAREGRQREFAAGAAFLQLVGR